MTLAIVQKWYLLMPLLAAFLYALAALGLKAASARGLDLLRINFIATWGTALAFVVFIKPSAGLIPDPWWPPVLLGGAFFLGQIFTFLALSRGDVSLATPLMGTKVIIVALLLTTVFNQPVSWQIWVGAIVAVGGIVCLQATNRRGHWSHITITLFASLGAAAAYAAFDSIVQYWSKQPGVGYARLVPAGLLIAALASTALLPLAERGWRRAPRGAYGVLAFGVALVVAQAMILITAIGTYGDAAACNIVYGSRGIWSIVVVWWLGHHFDNRELHVERAVIIARLIGSAMVMAAIVLAFA